MLVCEVLPVGVYHSNKTSFNVFFFFFLQMHIFASFSSCVFLLGMKSALVRQCIRQSEGGKPWHNPDFLLWTSNYSLSWKMEDPCALCSYVLYLTCSNEVHLIMHYVGTMANCCHFVQVISNSAASQVSGEDRNERVENVKTLETLLNKMSQSSCVMHNARQDDRIGWKEKLSTQGPNLDWGGCDELNA